MKDDGQGPERVEAGQQGCRCRQGGEDQKEPQRGQGQFREGVDRVDAGACGQESDRDRRPEGQEGGDREEQTGQAGAEPWGVRGAVGSGRGVALRGYVAAHQEEDGEGLEEPGDGGQLGQVLEGTGGVKGVAVRDEGGDQPVAQDYAEYGEGPEGVHCAVSVGWGGGVDVVGGSADGGERGSGAFGAGGSCGCLGVLPAFDPTAVPTRTVRAGTVVGCG